MSDGSAERILFVVDEPGFARNLGAIRELGGAPMSVRDVTPTAIAGHRHLAVDVDLTQMGNVKQLRAALRARRGGFLAFAVDLNRRLETVYAHVIGASELLRRPFSGAEIRERIAAFEEARRTMPVHRVAAESIASAADALGDMFTALTGGNVVEMPAVVTASADIVDAISDIGFSSWVDTVRQHHEGTFQHCLIVTGLATAFARSTGMSRKDTTVLTTAGLLHDIGKAAVPVGILDKPGRLTESEFEVIRSHPARGYDHLRAQTGIDGDVLRAVRGHHEYLDGSGYPDGLIGGDVGDLTRILTICDVYGALIERRSYKPPRSSDEALAVLDEMASAGKLEMPLVRAFHQTVAA